MANHIRSAPRALIISLAVLFGLTACKSAKQQWSEARQQGTVEAFQLFLSRNPQGEYSEQARRRLSDVEGWRSARKSDSVVAYEAYVDQHPDGAYRDEGVFRGALIKAKSENTIRAYKEFFAIPPAGAGSSQAFNETEEVFWKLLVQKGKAGDFKEFGQKHKSSPHLNEALDHAKEFDVKLITAGTSNSFCKTEGKRETGFLLEFVARYPDVQMTWDHSAAKAFAGKTVVPLNAIRPAKWIGSEGGIRQRGTLSMCVQSDVNIGKTNLWDKFRMNFYTIGFTNQDSAALVSQPKGSGMIVALLFGASFDLIDKIEVFDTYVFEKSSWSSQ